MARSTFPGPQLYAATAACRRAEPARVVLRCTKSRYPARIFAPTRIFCSGSCQLPVLANFWASKSICMSPRPNPPPSGGSGPVRNWVGNLLCAKSPVPDGPGGLRARPQCDSLEPMPPSTNGSRFVCADALSTYVRYFVDPVHWANREGSVGENVVRRTLLTSGASVPSKTDQVSGPTTPSSASPCSVWKRLSALSVSGPNTPSTSKEKPSALSSVCSSFTSPDSSGEVLSEPSKRRSTGCPIELLLAVMQ